MGHGLRSPRRRPAARRSATRPTSRQSTYSALRGVDLPGSVRVSIDELTLEEARQVLLGEHAATTSDLKVIQCADDLARLLGRWAMLVAMAGGVVRPQLGGRGTMRSLR